MTHPRRFDHEAAFEFFAADAGRSFNAVAAQFHVSAHTIGKVARRDNWLERRDELHRKAAEKTVLRTLEERKRRTLKAIDQTRDAYIAKLGVGQVDVTPSDLATVVKLEQLLEGHATGRVETVEVQTAFQRTLQAFVELVVLVAAEQLPKRYQQPLVVEVRRRIPATVESALGELAA